MYFGLLIQETFLVVHCKASKQQRWLVLSCEEVCVQSHMFPEWAVQTQGSWQKRCAGGIYSWRPQFHIVLLLTCFTAMDLRVTAECYIWGRFLTSWWTQSQSFLPLHVLKGSHPAGADYQGHLWGGLTLQNFEVSQPEAQKCGLTLQQNPRCVQLNYPWEK